MDWIAKGNRALERADWDGAKRAFENALEQAPSPQAHDGLGLALWWLNEIRAAHHHKTLAFQGYKKRGETERAVMTAIWLAREQVFLNGNVSAMKGWFARAERLPGENGRGIERAWLALLRASVTAPAERLERAAEEAIAQAETAADENLEAIALAFSGIARVTQGRVTQGMANLDEAMAAALSGEIALVWVSEIFCLMLSACDLASDLERTEQWCRTAQEYAEKNKFPFLAAVCRVTYGSLLTATGKWERAQEELTRAIAMFERGHTALRVPAVLKLADLRVLQGRLNEAEAMLSGFEDQGGAAVPFARLVMARGEPALARAILEQQLAPKGSLTLDKAPLLRLLVEVCIELQDLAGALASAARLNELAQGSDSAVLLAQAELAQGQALRAQGSPEASVMIAAALERLQQYDQSLLAARARLEMAQLTRESDRPAAITWARAAQASFTRLGAVYEADRAGSLLRQMGVSAIPRAGSQDALTPRENEVLQLLGKGLTNREIGKRLVVSPKTVEHHVSQILAKLGAHTRAEAAAMAARQQV